MTDNRDTKIVSRAARRLRWLTLFGAAALLGATVYAVVAPVSALELGLIKASIEIEHYGVPGRWAAVGTSAVTSVLLSYAFWRLSRMLRHVENGETFGLATVRHFRAFALFVFVSVLVSILLPTLLQITLALGQPPGQRQVGLTLEGSDMWALFVSGLLFFVARLLDAAQRLADDNRMII